MLNPGCPNSVTIAIPTYNRHEQLYATLQALLVCEQISNVDVLIVDNHSSPSVQEFLNAKFLSLPSNFKLHRNASNVGICANILRCIELSQKSWVWLLGDDDKPLPHAINAIILELQSAKENAFLLKFSSANSNIVPSKICIEGLREFSNICIQGNYFSNLLFISSSVFNRNISLKYLNTAYHWAYSMGPQIVIMVKAVIDGYTIKTSCEEIVSHGSTPGKTWSPIRLVHGMMTLSEIEGADEFARCAMPFIAEMYIGQKWLQRIIVSFVRPSTRDKFFWRSFWTRIGCAIRGPKGFIIILLSVLLCILSPIGTRLVSILFKNRYDKIPENLEFS